MLRKFTAQEGMTTVELLLITPFALFFLLAALQVIQALVAQNVVTSAAREAARTLAVHHDVALAKQHADEVISGTLPTGRSNHAIASNAAGNATGNESELAAEPLPLATGTEQLSFSTTPPPENDYTYNFDPERDVCLYDDGQYCTAIIRYHVRTLCPALPKLFDPNASAWSKWLNVSGKAAFRHEFDSGNSQG